MITNKWILILVLSIIMSSMIIAEEAKTKISWYRKNYSGTIGKEKINLLLINRDFGYLQGELTFEESDKKYVVTSKLTEKKVPVMIIEDSSYEKFELKMDGEKIEAEIKMKDKEYSVKLSAKENYEKTFGLDLYTTSLGYNPTIKDEEEYSPRILYSLALILPSKFIDINKLEKLKKVILQIYFNESYFSKSEIETNEMTDKLMEKIVNKRIETVKGYGENYRAGNFENYLSLTMDLEYCNNNILGFNILKEAPYGGGFAYWNDHYVIDLKSVKLLSFNDLFNNAIFRSGIFKNIDICMYNSLGRYKSMEVDENNIHDVEDLEESLYNFEIYQKELILTTLSDGERISYKKEWEKIPLCFFKKDSVLMKEKFLLCKREQAEEYLSDAMKIYEKEKSPEAALSKLEEEKFTYFISESIDKNEEFYSSSIFKKYLFLLTESIVRYKEAADYIEKAIKKYPDEPIYYLYGANAYSKLFLTERKTEYKKKVEEFDAKYTKLTGKTNQNSFVRGIVSGKMKKITDIKGFPVRFEKNEDNGMYNFIDKRGKILFSGKYLFEGVSNFNGFFQIVTIENDGDYTFALVDYKGNVIVKKICPANDSYDVRDFRVVINIAGKYLIFDRGKRDKNFVYDYANDNGDVCFEGKWRKNEENNFYIDLPNDNCYYLCRRK